MESGVSWSHSIQKTFGWLVLVVPARAPYDGNWRGSRASWREFASSVDGSRGKMLLSLEPRSLSPFGIRILTSEAAFSSSDYGLRIHRISRYDALQQRVHLRAGHKVSLSFSPAATRTVPLTQ